jgi:hypothetical protein
MSADAPPLAADPIIIAGPPRTGVRLLAAILDGHPSFASGPELPFLLTMAHQWRDIETTLGANHARHYQLSSMQTRENFRSSMLRLVVPRAASAGKARFVYHSFGAAVSLDVLAELFPDARFVVMLRDPRAVASSLLRCDWRNPQDGTPLPYTRDAGAAAKLWTDFMGLALRSVPALEAGRRLMLLRYEELCAHPAASLERLGGFLGASPPPARVGMESARVVTATLGDPHPALRAGDLDSRSVGAWRTALEPGAVARVEQATATLRSRLGYG